MIAVAIAVIAAVIAVTCGIVADSNHADSLTFLGLMVKTTAAQIFLAGAICTWALFASLWLLSAGIRRSKERSMELRMLKALRRYGVPEELGPEPAREPGLEPEPEWEWEPIPGNSISARIASLRAAFGAAIAGLVPKKASEANELTMSASAPADAAALADAARPADAAALPNAAHLANAANLSATAIAAGAAALADASRSVDAAVLPDAVHLANAANLSGTAIGMGVALPSVATDPANTADSADAAESAPEPADLADSPPEPAGLSDSEPTVELPNFAELTDFADLAALGDLGTDPTFGSFSTLDHIHLIAEPDRGRRAESGRFYRADPSN